MNHTTPKANIETEVPGITHFIGVKVNLFNYKMIGNTIDD